MLLPARPPQFLLGLLQSSDQQKPTLESTSLPTAPRTSWELHGEQSWGTELGEGSWARPG